MPRKVTYVVLAFCFLSVVGPMLARPLILAVESLGTIPKPDRLGVFLFVLAMFLTAGMITLGVLSAKLIRPFTPQKPSRSTDEKPPCPEHQPKDFSQRLAGYLHCDQEQLVEPRPYPESKMSFWSRVGRLRWMGPKPAYLIRRLLERIREQVRGRAH